MNIKNYTSAVPVSESIRRIELMLVDFGAQHISKTYSPDRQIDALTFLLPLPDGRSLPVRLPVRANEVENALRAEVKRPRASTFENIKEQSNRTAWRLMQDWVHIQLSLIQMGQVVPLEVFLPFVFDSSKQKTVYQIFEDNKFKSLPFFGVTQ